MKTPDNTPVKEENETSEEFIEIEVPYHVFQFLSSENSNIQQMCRICLSTENDEMISLFCTKENKILSDMFMSFTAINMSSDDGLPTQVCTTCKTQIEFCYEFKIKCENTDSMLKSLLKGEFITKEVLCQNQQNQNSQAIKDVKIDSKPTEAIIPETKIKEELNEELEFLEDLAEDEAASDDDNLFIVQKEQKRKKLSDQGVAGKKRGRKKKYISCSHCSKQCKNLTSLRLHINRFHTNERKAYPCLNCKKSYDSAYDLKLHSAIHNGGSTWKCNSCQKEFSSRAMLRRHVQRHMESKPFACDACGKTFVEAYALRRHMRVHTGEKIEKKFQCHICQKRFPERRLLEFHLSQHAGVRPHVCSVCGKSFVSPRLLASHTLVHTDTKPYRCQYCDKRFRHESTRNTHHRTHTGEKPYVCPMCGKTFIQNSNLTRHMRTHTGEKPYSCSTCNRGFSSSSSLKTHIRTHTGQKPYACNVCGKRFARMDMKVHMRQHTGERPYSCTMCAKKFIKPSALRQHFRIHTGERPYQCDICAQTCATRGHLVKHLKTHEEKKKKRDVLLVQRVDYNRPIMLAESIALVPAAKIVNTETNTDKTVSKASNRKVLDVTEGVVLEDDEKTDLLVVDRSNTVYDTENVCLSTNEVNIVDNTISDVNLVTVNEGQVSISASSAVIDGGTVKLYQMDQSLVQIHSTSGQVTISKITSKMTANF